MRGLSVGSTLILLSTLYVSFTTLPYYQRKRYRVHVGIAPGFAARRIRRLTIEGICEETIIYFFNETSYNTVLNKKW